MTSEKRILVSPKDILSLGFECPHCSTTYFSPIDKLDELVRQCPNCRQSWATDAPVSSSSYSDLKTLVFFVDFLRQIRNREFGLNIRFEIAGEKPEMRT